MRNRLEDLGRISVLIKQLMDCELFSLYSGRDKDFVDFFDEMSIEKQQDMLTGFVYGISNVEEKILEILEIANGEDYLNNPIDC